MRPARPGHLVVLVALLPACQPLPAPPSAGRTLIGQPYTSGGVWSYPREDFAGSETGIAAILPDRAGGRVTANGEVFDPTRLLAAHRTLQLPAILTVWNLETGREVQVRVNDRGPTEAGRLLGLSRRAAELLGVPPGGTAAVRITVDGPPSRALASALPGDCAPLLTIATAPRGAVMAENLPPPPGSREAGRRQAPAGAVPARIAAKADPGLPPDPLPEAVLQRFAVPVRLLVEAGSFFRRDLAQRQAASLPGARTEPFGEGRQPRYRVRLGPFATVAEADRAVAAVLAAGHPEVRLLVE